MNQDIHVLLRTECHLSVLLVSNNIDRSTLCMKRDTSYKTALDYYSE